MLKLRGTAQLILFGVLSLLLLAQRPLGAQRYQIKTYGLREGLPTAEITSMAQGRDGQIWFSSRAGIISYDGLKWEVETPERLQGGESFYFVRCDPLGRIWTLSGTRAFMRGPESWQSLPALQDRFLVGDEVPVDFRIEVIKGEPRPLIIYPSGKILIFGGKSWQNVLVGDETGPVSIRSIEVTPQAFLLATSRGVFRLDLESGETVQVELPPVDGGIHCLAYDREKELVWAVGTYDIGHFPAADILKDSVELTVETKDIDITGYMGAGRSLRAVADGRAGIYFGNYAFVGHFCQRQGLQILHRENGLIAEGAHSILLDREQNVWIATSRGVSKIISRRLAGYDSEHKLFDDEVTAVKELPDGTILLGHNGGLTGIGKKKISRLDFGAGVTRGRVMDLAVDSQGTIWAACELFGLLEIEWQAGAEFKIKKRYATPTPTGPALNSITFDSEGRTWIGTNSGLFRLENGAYVSVDIDANNTKATSIRRVTTGSQGRIYVATIARGLVILDGRTLVECNEPLYLRNTYTAFESRDGTVWVGARDGLCMASEGRLIFPENFEVRRPVYGIVEDRDGRLWFGTDNGVFRWNGKKLDHLTTDNGLIGLEINRAGTFLDSRGRVWIGTDRGVSVFDPDEEPRESEGPSLEFLKLEVDGEYFDFGTETEDPIELSYNSRNLTFSFRTISFVDEEKVRYRTKLVGYDGDWSEPRRLPLREVRYSTLPPGDYELQIVPIDVNGLEGPLVSSGTIVVAMPFWQEIWFLGVGILAIAALGAGVYGLLSQRRHARKLEEEVRIRSEELQRSAEAQARIARLDSLGVLAGGIAHDFNNLLTAIGGGLALIEGDPQLDDDCREALGAVEKACWKAQTLTRQLLTFSRGGEPVREVASLPEILNDAASFSLRGSAIDCKFEIPEDLPLVYIDIGQFHQVFNNVLINARQAMPRGGSIKISAAKIVRDSKDYVAVTIKDNGIGIDEANLPHIFDPYFSTKPEGNGLGLAIAHSIIRKHDGDIEIKSRMGSGTSLSITIPATQLPLETSDEPIPSFRRLSGRILIMDDQDSIRAVTKRSLERLGCQVVACEEGAEAVRLYEEAFKAGDPFPLVLMDLTVPGAMGGLEATRLILKIDADARVIVTSGYSQDAALSDFKSHGFCDRLPKPFSPEDLNSVMSRNMRSS